LRWTVLAAAVVGATFGAKLLSWLEDPPLALANLHNPAFFVGGKTIVGALAAGLIAVELMKRYIGIHQSTGDLYSIPLAAGIAIGRIGCFLTGLPDNTYGTPTHLPWAVNFGDGIPRHPTQIYEIIFLLALIPFLFFLLKRIVILSEVSPSRSGGKTKSKDPVFLNATTGSARNSLNVPPLATRYSVLATRFLPGDAFKLFMVAYMSFRLLCDFIKPYPRIFLGLGSIQWVCVFILLFYSPDITRWLRKAQSQELIPQPHLMSFRSGAKQR
jgi:phosphatidylglycerol---prolipoprotein diacylglyceryl transferase